MNELLAAGASASSPWAWLGGGVSVSILVAAVAKIGRWVGSVESRLGQHDRALHRIGKELAGEHEASPEERST